MASVQEGVKAHRSIHHDCQQLSDVKSVLMDCAEKLKNADNSRMVIAKSTKLAFEVLDVIGDDTKAGLKAPAPSHSFVAVMNRDGAEKRRELVEETGMVMSENNPEKSLQEPLKREKSPAGKNARATTNGSSIISPSPKKTARRSANRH
jgi:hypothetical protein